MSMRPPRTNRGRGRGGHIMRPPIRSPTLMNNFPLRPNATEPFNPYATPSFDPYANPNTPHRPPVTPGDIFSWIESQSDPFVLQKVHMHISTRLFQRFGISTPCHSMSSGVTAVDPYNARNPPSESMHDGGFQPLHFQPNQQQSWLHAHDHGNEEMGSPMSQVHGGLMMKRRSAPSSTWSMSNVKLPKNNMNSPVGIKKSNRNKRNNKPSLATRKPNASIVIPTEGEDEGYDEAKADRAKMVKLKENVGVIHAQLDKFCQKFQVPMFRGSNNNTENGKDNAMEIYIATHLKKKSDSTKDTIVECMKCLDGAKDTLKKFENHMKFEKYKDWYDKKMSVKSETSTSNLSEVLGDMPKGIPHTKGQLDPSRVEVSKEEHKQNEEEEKSDSVEKSSESAQNSTTTTTTNDHHHHHVNDTQTNNVEPSNIEPK